MENTNMPVISAKDLNLWYGDFKALKGISLDVGEREITALIGPSRENVDLKNPRIFQIYEIKNNFSAIHGQSERGGHFEQ